VRHQLINEENTEKIWKYVSRTNSRGKILTGNLYENVVREIDFELTNKFSIDFFALRISFSRE
jgi:hypothetical protein